MGARVYNLFPTLAGPAAGWDTHFERIAAMNFDWVFLNPIHRTGGSGSLYAVADYYELHPVVRGTDRRATANVVEGLVRTAERRGLSVMLDLVMNHTANDSPLVAKHPDWYVRDATGAVVAPSCVDPDDAAKITVWGDLAEIDYRERPERNAVVAYFADVVRFYARVGVRGFRCDAAYKIPGDVWAEVIAAARDIRSDCVFAAETLGCAPHEIMGLGGAGFDYLFNSSKWWDFRAGWLMEQYERNRQIAPSIAFPESHDTPRVAAELAGSKRREIEAEYRFRYLFAALFSSGVMMPIGYEFGFARKLDVVRTRPKHWEKRRFDLREFIAAVNSVKASRPALSEEGPAAVVALGADAVALVRHAARSDDEAVALINPARDAVAHVDIADLADRIGGRLHDLTPGAPHSPTVGTIVRLAPLEIRLFVRADDEPLASNGAPMPQIAELADAEAGAGTAGPVAIEHVTPQLDCGRYPIKRVVGEPVVVEADVFRDGHDALSAVLYSRECGSARWRHTPMRHLGNDRWTGSFDIARAVPYEYAIEAWPDPFVSWQAQVEKKRAAGQPLAREAAEGRELLGAALGRASGTSRERLATAVTEIDELGDDDSRVAVMLGDGVAALVARVPDRSAATRTAPLRVEADRRAAAFAAWYELFPRSAGSQPGKHGTFADVERRLPDIRAMGFDVVYLPPIHPIGYAFRKGRNNTLEGGPDAVGSPWAIGNEHGGHTSIESKLGTFDDFARLVAAARANSLEIALDYALQCSPDHPWITEHPEWFAFRADGSIKYAENPPKKYQDIVNFNWSGLGPHRQALWDALRDVVLFWIDRGVSTFRVDNPHTKPFAFWEWMIAEVRAKHPETIFLAEAFTRPKVMNQLAKLGFSQSYTYFTWRDTKAELTEYLTELAQTEMAEFYRPHFWPNTPDILTLYLQTGGRPAFRIRLALAATLSSLYGIYSGYELCENDALPEREEYLDSEKYEIRVRDWDAPTNIKADVARLNRIRRENPALHDWRNVEFYRADDDQVIFYGKRAGDNIVFAAVNLDPFAAHDPTLWFPTGALGIADDEPYDIEELLDRTKHVWRGSSHRWRLDPQTNPAAIFRLTLRKTT